MLTSELPPQRVFSLQPRVSTSQPELLLVIFCSGLQLMRPSMQLQVAQLLPKLQSQLLSVSVARLQRALTLV